MSTDEARELTASLEECPGCGALVLLWSVVGLSADGVGEVGSVIVCEECKSDA